MEEAKVWIQGLIEMGVLKRASEIKGDEVEFELTEKGEEVFRQMIEQGLLKEIPKGIRSNKVTLTEDGKKFAEDTKKGYN